MNDLAYDPDFEVAETDLKKESDSENTNETSQQNEKKLPESVPYTRFSDVNKERNQYKQELEAARIELAKLQGQQSAYDKFKQHQEKEKVKEFDEDEANKKLYEALSIGDNEEALKIRKEIKNFQQDQINKMVEEKARKIAEEMIGDYRSKNDKQSFDKIINDILMEHEELDSNSGIFDKTLAEEFAILFNGKLATGASPIDAINYAKGKIFLTKEKENKYLSKDEINKQQERAATIPPHLGNKGKSNRELNVDPLNMSEEEFEKWREAGGKLDIEKA